MSLPRSSPRGGVQVAFGGEGFQAAQVLGSGFIRRVEAEVLGTQLVPGPAPAEAELVAVEGDLKDIFARGNPEPSRLGYHPKKYGGQTIGDGLVTMSNALGNIKLTEGVDYSETRVPGTNIVQFMLIKTPQQIFAANQIPTSLTLVINSR